MKRKLEMEFNYRHQGHYAMRSRAFTPYNYEAIDAARGVGFMRAHEADRLIAAGGVSHGE